MEVRIEKIVDMDDIINLILTYLVLRCIAGELLIVLFIIRSKVFVIYVDR